MAHTVLGIDPGSNGTAWAVATLTEIKRVGIVKSKPTEESSTQITMLRYTHVALEDIFRKHPEISLVVVEGQQIHRGQTKSPDSITKLTLVAGGIIGQIVSLSPQCKIVAPDSDEWKGQQPKRVSQGRTFTHYGVLFDGRSDYMVPSGCARISVVPGYEHLNPGDWRDVGDALGLALWGSRLLASSAS